MSERTVIHCGGCNRFRKQSQRTGPCRCGGEFVRRPIIPQRLRIGRGNRMADELASAMVAAYAAGKSLTEVGRIFPLRGKARTYTSVREVLRRRGVVIRESAMSRTREKCPVTGRLLAKRRFSDDEIKELISKESRMRIPPALKWEWRIWSVERRRLVLGWLRDRFPSTRPTGTLVLEGAMFFDRCTPEAQALCDSLNVGTNSWTAVIKLDVRSEGIIFEDEFWFWLRKTGYLRMGPWKSDATKAMLQRHLWERWNGELPPSHVVQHVNGNRNDFSRENLVAVHREKLLRSNQNGALNRRANGTLKTLMAGGKKLAVVMKSKGK